MVGAADALHLGSWTSEEAPDKIASGQSTGCDERLDILKISGGYPFSPSTQKTEAFRSQWIQG